MRTRILWWTTTISLIALGFNLWAQFPGWSRENARRSAAAERLVESLRLDEAVTAAAARTIVEWMASVPEWRPHEDILTDYVEEKAGWDVLKPSVVHVYAETFTEQELDELHRFYTSPTGRKLVETSPDIALRIQAVTRESLESEMDVLETRMKNRVLQNILEMSVFAPAQPAAEPRR